MKVSKDFSSGAPRPVGHGIVVKTAGCGAATVSSVKCHATSGERLTHNNIPFSAIILGN